MQSLKIQSVLIIGCLLLLGCEQGQPARSPAGNEADPNVTGKDVRREAGEAANAAGEYASQKSDEFMAKMRKNLSNMDESIEKMRARGKEMTGEAKVKWEAALKDMEEKRAELAVKMDEWKESGGAAWQDFKSGLEKAWSELDRSAEKAAEHFKNDPAAEREDEKP